MNNVNHENLIAPYLWNKPMAEIIGSAAFAQLYYWIEFPDEWDEEKREWNSCSGWSYTHVLNRKNGTDRTRMTIAEALADDNKIPCDIGDRGIFINLIFKNGSRCTIDCYSGKTRTGW